MYNILVCDDERDIVSALKIYLTAENYNVIEAYSGYEALKAVGENEIHLILMDIMMPEMDGITAMLRIRETSNVPIILISAKSEDTDKILGLNVGADDYITKPFNPVEVQARVRSQLRRYLTLGAGTLGANRIRIGGIELDDEKKAVRIDCEEVSLTPTEYNILRLLMSRPGKVFSPAEIYSEVWKDTPIAVEGTVAVHIRHLREKVEIDPGNPRYIKVVWGKGYKMEEFK